MSKREGNAAIETVVEVERSLEQARQIMAPGRLHDDAEGWLLLATLVGEADLAFQRARRRDPTLAWPLLEAVVEELYEMTSGFTDPLFLRHTRAARRCNPALFRTGVQRNRRLPACR